MQKTEFIEHVAKEAGVTRSEADKVVRATLDVIKNAMRDGEKITLTGFGSFEVRNRGERQVTSIRTKEKVTVAASKLPSFSAGSELKAAVNGKAAPKEAKEPALAAAPAPTATASKPTTAKEKDKKPTKAKSKK